MLFRIIYKIFILLIIVIISLPIPAIALSPISDTISVSWPSFPSDHEIKFLTHEAIPAGGKIVITPMTSDFSALAGFDYESFDLSTSSSQNGSFVDRQISSATSTTNDAVSITVSGAGTTTLNQISINLNTSVGIATNTYVLIEIGTNALYGATGTYQILNASSTGPQIIEIETRNAQNQKIENITIGVVMIAPVQVNASFAKVRSNGKPDGVLAYGTTQTQMSLNTNYNADCRYSITAGTSYDLMSNDFTYTGAYFHSTIISGLVSGQTYTYYIRCQDSLSVNDTSDYIIQFEISGQEGDEGEDSGTPGSGGGGSGGGGGGGAGVDQGDSLDWGTYLPYPPLPGLPGVVLTGWGYPSREVLVLKDGTEIGKAIANTNAEFGAFIEDLDQGVYTFSMWSSDINQNKSNTFSTTFWIDEGTQTTVSDIILSPSMALNKKEFASGETITLSGYSVPGKTIEVWLYPKDIINPGPEDANITTMAVFSDGKYSVAVNTVGLKPGEYYIKAKTVIEITGESDFSHPVLFAIDQTLTETGSCDGADLNGDGRINLTDFSILLYYWGTDDDCADQNDDRTVDLTDFSIMMFYWTG